MVTDAAATHAKGNAMKALVYKGPGEKSWEDVHDPAIQHPTDIIVKIDATTICGTDHAGRPRLAGAEIPESHLGVTPAGLTSLRIEAGEEPVRAVLIGGEPLGESIVMWWNFVGRSHDEVVAFREQWQAEVIAGSNSDGRFGTVTGYPGAALPAPELPNVRLRPRD